METLSEKIARFGSPLDMLRASQMGPYAFPIPSEFSNWRSEQQAWRDSVALMDQSFHMTDLYVEGPGAIAFIESLAINGFKTFGQGKAKQLICCAPNGYLVGDMIMFALSDEELLEEATAEFERRKGDREYESPLPADADPYELTDR